MAAARAAAAEDGQENHQAELIMSRGGEHKKPIIVNSMAMMPAAVDSTPSSSIKLIPGSSDSKKEKPERLGPQAQHFGEYENILSSPSELNSKSHLDISSVQKNLANTDAVHSRINE